MDDLLVSATHKHVADNFINNINAVKSLGTQWRVKNLGKPATFLGLECHWTQFGLKLTHTRMIEKLVNQFHVCKDAIHTPMSPNTTLEPTDHALSKPDHSTYRSSYSR